MARRRRDRGAIGRGGAVVRTIVKIRSSVAVGRKSFSRAIRNSGRGNRSIAGAHRIWKTSLGHRRARNVPSLPRVDVAERIWNRWLAGVGEVGLASQRKARGGCRKRAAVAGGRSVLDEPRSQ